MLTEEQRKLVANNTKLVHHCLRLRYPAVNCRTELYEEMYAEGLLFLSKAALLWRPDGAKFSTYACVTIIRGLMRWSSVAPAKGIRGSPEGRRPSWYDAALDEMPGRQPAEDEGTKEFAESLLAKIPPREADVLRRHFAGWKYEAISRDMGVSKERVRQIRNQGLNRIRKMEGVS